MGIHGTRRVSVIMRIIINEFYNRIWSSDMFSNSNIGCVG